MQRKKIVVCGATGKQGGAVVSALLRENLYDITAITREPGSALAAKLRMEGVTVVQASLTDQSSLLNAFSGAYGVFGITQPWSGKKDRYDIPTEIIHGKNIIWAYPHVRP